MITGSNEVYTPVDAYRVATYADSVISGGNTGNEVISGNTRFYWVYDPNDPYGKTTSGFTGQGWFENILYSPIGYYMTVNGDKDIMVLINDIFGDSGTNNLNNVFDVWQNYVKSNPEAVGNFQTDIILKGQELGRNCFRTY